MSENRNIETLQGDSRATVLTELLPVFVGNREAVEKFQKVLDKREPSFVVVTGEAGMGKTSFLRFVSATAATNGWTVIPKETNAVFCVTPETTESLFATRIRELIAIPLGESFIETKSSQLDLYPIVRQLRERAPLLLLIDGFQASPDFTSWFTDWFIRDVRRTNSPVVVTIAERPDQAKNFSALADEILPFGKLDKQLIKEHFERIGKQLSSPIEGNELEEYAEAAFKRPELIGSLTRVLRLASLGQI